MSQATLSWVQNPRAPPLTLLGCYRHLSWAIGRVIRGLSRGIRGPSRAIRRYMFELARLGLLMTRLRPLITRPITQLSCRYQHPLCYAILLLGRKSVFRDACRPDSSRGSRKIGPPAGLRPAGGPMLMFSRLDTEPML